MLPAFGDPFWPYFPESRNGNFCSGFPFLFSFCPSLDPPLILYPITNTILEKEEMGYIRIETQLEYLAENRN